MAWLWLSAIVDTEKDRERCIQEALKIQLAMNRQLVGELLESNSNSQILHLLERIATALERIPSLFTVDISQQEQKTNDVLQPVLQNSNQVPFNSHRAVSLQDFLLSRGISIKTIPQEQESDDVLDKIAVFIGDRFASVQVLLDAIKTNMNAGKTFSLNLKNASQQAISDITQLCTTLHNIAFLTNYRYQKSPAYQLYATPSTSPNALNFYSGQWLERFVKTQVVSLLHKNSLPFSYLRNPQIVLPNGDDFELDMLFETQGEIFWIEAKTGDYRRHIAKYSRVAKIMKLDRSHTFMVLADDVVTDVIAKDLSNLFGMTVVRIEKFVEHLEMMLPNRTVPGQKENDAIDVSETSVE